MGCDDLVRPAALTLVVRQQLSQRNVVDNHVGVVGLAHELRVLTWWLSKEEDLEPAVLDPAQVRDQACHRHQRRWREDRAVRVLLGQPLALPVHESALQIEPADELGSLFGNERRAVAGRCHPCDASSPGDRTKPTQPVPRVSRAVRRRMNRRVKLAMVGVLHEQDSREGGQSLEGHEDAVDATRADPQRRAAYRRSAGSPRGEARRRELLERVTDDLAVNGLVDFSLRRAARAAGSTHKVLLYYFEGADDLLRQAILQLRERRIGNALAAIAALPAQQTLA